MLSELSPDGASRKTVREGSFLATEAGQWGFLPICFEPLEESAGRSYEITFSATSCIETGSAAKFALHLDTAAMTLAGDSPREQIGLAGDRLPST